MTIDSLTRHSESVVKECKELATFLQAIQEAELQRCRMIADACKIFESNCGNFPTGGDTSIWTAVHQLIEDYNLISVTCKKHSLDIKKTVLSPFIDAINLHDVSRRATMYVPQKVITRYRNAALSVNQWKTEFEELHEKTAKVAERLSNLKINSLEDEKEYQKLQSRAQELLLHTTEASDRIEKYEKERDSAHQEYLNIDQQEFYKEAARLELQTMKTIHKAVRQISTISRINSEERRNIYTKMSDRAFAVDLDEDMNEFAKQHLTTGDIATISRTPARKMSQVLKAKKVAMKKGEHAWGIETRYIVLLESSSNLLCFQSENSDIPTEIINLVDFQVYSIDDSYFGKPNCFLLINKQNVIASSTQNKHRKESFQSRFSLPSVASRFGRKQSEPDTSIIPTNPEGMSDSNATLKDIYFFAESAAEKSEWLYLLRPLCYCCELCADSYGFHENTNEPKGSGSLTDMVVNAPSHTTEGIHKPSTADATRRMHVWIMEAKDILNNASAKSVQKLSQESGAPALSSTLSSGQMYCVVLLNDVKQARTTTSSDVSPFWGEDFTFGEVPPCVSKLGVLLYQASASENQGDVEIGYVSLNLKGIKPGKKVEEWYPIRAFKDANTYVGTMRLAISITNELRLPMELTERFLASSLNKSMTAVKAMNILPSQQREPFAGVVVNILMAHNRHVDGIKELMTHEILSTNNENIIFRGSTIATKALDHLMKVAGRDYLTCVLVPLIKSVYQSTDSCEVDPLKYDQSTGVDRIKDSIKRHWKQLLSHVTAFWDAISSSWDKCPQDLVLIFTHMKGLVEEKFGTRAKYSAISGFIFLRFFCPAILSPKLFLLMNDHPHPTASRTLTLIAKILQNLANLTVFENKEPYMVQSNDFIEDNTGAMMIFIDRISEIPSSTTVADPAPVRYQMIDLNHETFLLHSFFSQVKNKLAESFSDDENITQLLPSIDELDKFVSTHTEKRHQPDTSVKSLDNLQQESKLQNEAIPTPIGRAQSDLLLVSATPMFDSPLSSGVKSGKNMRMMLLSKQTKQHSSSSNVLEAQDVPLVSATPYTNESFLDRGGKSSKTKQPMLTKPSKSSLSVESTAEHSQSNMPCLSASPIPNDIPIDQRSKSTVRPGVPTSPLKLLNISKHSKTNSDSFIRSETQFSSSPEDNNLLGFPNNQKSSRRQISKISTSSKVSTQSSGLGWIEERGDTTYEIAELSKNLNMGINAEEDLNNYSPYAASLPVGSALRGSKDFESKKHIKLSEVIVEEEPVGGKPKQKRLSYDAAGNVTKHKRFGGFTGKKKTSGKSTPDLTISHNEGNVVNSDTSMRSTFNTIGNRRGVTNSTTSDDSENGGRGLSAISFIPKMFLSGQKTGASKANRQQKSSPALNTNE